MQTNQQKIWSKVKKAQAHLMYLSPSSHHFFDSKLNFFIAQKESFYYIFLKLHTDSDLKIVLIANHGYNKPIFTYFFDSVWNIYYINLTGYNIVKTTVFWTEFDWS